MLALLRDHGVVIQRRLRTEDGLNEVHVIWFPSDAHFAAYRDDPARAAHTHLFTLSGANAEVLTVRDVRNA